MNTIADSRTLRMFVLFTLAALLLPCFAVDASAGELAASIFRANFLYDLVSDRARMLQVSVVFVGLGIALLWWRR